ncbi:MAG: hypothetical protein ABEI52_08370, partial [Halobacteriaceae archaeon]
MQKTACMAVLVLVILAGCTAPTANGDARRAATPSGPIPPPSSDAEPARLELRYDPGFNATRVLKRVERIRNVNATDTIVVHEFPPGQPLPRDIPDRFLDIRPAGATALALASNGTTIVSRTLGYTLRRNGDIHIYVMSPSGLIGRNVTQETILAHEFTHA